MDVMGALGDEAGDPTARAQGSVLHQPCAAVFCLAAGYALVVLGDIDHVVVLLHRKLCTTQPLGKLDAAFGNMWLAAGDGVDVVIRRAKRYERFVGYALLQMGKESRQL
jgi:hypothetical protein